jgi:uncharacterized protein (TIGR02001 family)
MPIDDHDRQPSLPTPALRPVAGVFAFFAAALLAPPCALAQTSADLSVVSEYTVRGISLGRNPAVQLRVDHDFDGGWYAGTFASPIDLYGRGQGLLIVYGGRALPLTTRLSWDAGVTRTIYLRNHEADYHEFYAGLTYDRVNARVSYSPAYYGGGRTVYLDLNGGIPLGERVALALHAGLLHPLDTNYHWGDEDRADLRATLAYDKGDWRLQAGVQTLVHGAGNGLPRARALFAGASLRF